MNSEKTDFFLIISEYQRFSVSIKEFISNRNKKEILIFF